MKAGKIKFRAKSIDKGVEPYYSIGQWVYGNFYMHEWDGGLMVDYAIITEVDRVSINPATVGQFTGLLDCNGKEIYEGDILSHRCSYPEGLKFYVRWNNEYAKFQLEDKCGEKLPAQLYCDGYTVIGNEFEEINGIGSLRKNNVKEHPK